MSTAGHSSEWVTGFVLWGLGKTAMTPKVEPARFALLSRQRKTGPWGFNRRIPGDADSTAWAVLGLSTAMQGARRDAAHAYLRRQQLSDGGFRTYSPSAERGLNGWAPQSENYDGWTSSHTCVTATAMSALIELGDSPSSASLAAAARHLASRQHARGLWPSYWWSGVTYATFQALHALRQCDALGAPAANAAANELLRRQRKTGGWAWNGTRSGFRSGALETAFAVLALMEVASLVEDRGALDASAARGVAWLCDNQTPDGRWPARPILRVPLPSDPREFLGAAAAELRPGGIGPDANGFFSAAAVVRCLRQYAAALPPEADEQAPQGNPSRRPARVSRVVRSLTIHEARAAFAEAMTARGLLISAEHRSRVLAVDRADGAVIAKRLTFVRKHIASAPAPSTTFSPHWLSKADAVLAFGASMTRVLAAAQGVRVHSGAVELGAVLVLGTAALDRACDDTPRLRKELFRLLDRDALRDLCRGDLAPSRLARIAARAEHWEVGYVLALVAEFFERLNRFVDTGAVRERAGSLLVAAYEAELATIRASSSDGMMEAHAAGRAARVLPFQVISTLNCGLAAHGCTGENGWPCDSPALLLGRAIAALDDLADLTTDVKRGTINSLLRAAESPDNAHGDGRGNRLLIDVVRSGACRDAARSVASTLDKLSRRLPSHMEDISPRDRLLAHTLGWGNLRGSSRASARTLSWRGATYGFRPHGSASYT